MIRIIAAVLAVGVLAACDGDPTGPTATDGEVWLRVCEGEYSNVWQGEGYNFATCEQVLITPYSGVGRKLDIGFLPADSESDFDIRIFAYPRRIYMGGEPISDLLIDYHKWANFELVTLDGKARYKITVDCKIGPTKGEWRRVYIIVMYYQIIE